MVDTALVGTGNAAVVALKSLAARNQPGGLPGVVVVEEDLSAGSPMAVTDAGDVRWRSLDLPDAGALLRRFVEALAAGRSSLVDDAAAAQAIHAAAVSEAALTGALAPAGLEV